MYLEIDGSKGEGGGQVLRSCLALSAVLGQPLRIRNIRSGRINPGLQPQHLTCVNAMATIAGAHVAGATLGSEGLGFTPQTLRSGTYRFDVAEVRPSAGSLSLVFQTVALPLAFARGPSKVTLQGGTHVPLSPSVHYIQNVYLPTIAKMGMHADIELKSWGWYPKGGGGAVAEVEPARLNGIDLSERGKQVGIQGISATSNLSLGIARRQQDWSMKLLESTGSEVSFETVDAPSRGTGSTMFILAEFENSRAGFASIGAAGKRAEEVSEEVTKECIEFLKTGAAVDDHLADQLILPMALAQGHSCFTTSKISSHLLTNIWVAEQFLPVEFLIEGDEGLPGRVSVDGAGFER